VSALTRSFNESLDLTLSDLALSHPELDLETAPIDALFASVQANSSAFGFTDVSSACLDSPGCREDGAVAET
jgi:phospholipase/lecithinase/hemolysin